MFWLSQRLLGEWSGNENKEVGFRFGRRSAKRPKKATNRKVIAFYDALEDRALLATAGYDYVLSGFKWANPTKITYSFPPDGVLWDAGYNTLNATLDAKLGGAWKREVARALATWQAAANINIVPVADGRYDFNSLGQQQGDPKFGDIRIGGFAFGGESGKSTLARAHFPPPQGSTAGGDIEINTNMSFQINGQYDFYSVILHETGHSLGLNHTASTTSVMASTYGGVRSGLTEGDIAGIRALYGARQGDVYRGQGLGGSANSPIELTSGLASSNTTTAAAASLNNIGEAEWFAFHAPAYASGVLNVTAGAAGVSLLSPAVSIYDASMNLLSRAGDPSAWSNDATASVASVVPGHRYFIKVEGATNDVFSVGSYNLTVSMPHANANPQPVRPAPVPTPTPTPVPWPTPSPTPAPVAPTPPVVNANVGAILPDRFESNDVIGAATRVGRTNQILLSGLTLHSADDADYFMFQNATAGMFQIATGETAVQVLNPRGGLVAQGVGSVSVSLPRNATVYIRVVSANFAPVAQYGLSIALQPAARQAAPPRGPLPGAALPRAPLPRAPLPPRAAPLPRFAMPRFALRMVAPRAVPARLVALEAPAAESAFSWTPASWNSRMRIASTG